MVDPWIFLRLKKNGFPVQRPETTPPGRLELEESKEASLAEGFRLTSAEVEREGGYNSLKRIQQVNAPENRPKKRPKRKPDHLPSTNFQVSFREGISWANLPQIGI